MKIVSFIPFESDEILFGLLEGEENIAQIEDPFQSEGIVKTGENYDIRNVILTSPTNPIKVLCIGLNYRDHAKEFGLAIPSSPVVFMKGSNTVIGTGAPIVKPELCRNLDYEAELAIVIKKDCKNISEEEADDYILGYCCANDVTARDLQPKDGQWTIAKGFDTFCPLGPYISDEVDPDNLSIECRVNGKTVQKSNTSNLIFKPRYLVSYLSKCMTLYAGDVISTGTPSGVGQYLKAGDVVEVEIEGLGILKNEVEA